ncbi:MAG: toll/interleukin-1 receptor domain-containing protein, partial [Leptolyngbya sp. SIO1D8]|nr:toll/interleukin-1 receptor domain-containing protein [Leptolyngbya sp. SIO1D8]
ETVLANIDLSQAQGLDTCEHFGPSPIDYRTLARSGQLPLSFLRGVGLPDTFIDYIPSLFNQPLQFYSCFISYSSKDEAFAQRLHADLQDKGVRCWYAPEDLPIGAKIRVGIDEAIRRYDKLLLILSEHSVNSQWVEQEVETALEKERERNQLVLFPIRVDEAVMTSGDGWTRLIKNTRNIGNFNHWQDYQSYQKGLERLVRDLKASLKST